jgi:catechol 2,3-dioxygenase-like lactoylglutathione lyase family enzyme
VGLGGLQHVLVLSDDMDATRDWYRDVLGLVVGARPPLPFPGHWLYAGDVPAIHVAQRDSYAAHARTLGSPVSGVADGAGPIDHVAFSARGYEEIVARLERHGVDAIRNTIPEIGVRQLFVRDPNGVQIEINVAPEGPGAT